ncbi:hypothetical protein KIK84_15215 [Curvibacter sp. CHRR-16]|uniref:hypothetical protein n=1 Tax=Curvibacter sp. CHRR-16 TaxID=2835872 RepID=UPI001BD95AEE|nr:hypothetical protein [Curvibacter sp. CHRR-16]MBT0571675.1 hypothetical protein [Curvibacter sp. CHRR-16]
MVEKPDLSPWSLLQGDNVVQDNAFVRSPTSVQASAFKEFLTIKDKSGAFIRINMKLQKA